MIESNSEIVSDDVAGHYDDLDHYYRLLWGDHLHHGLWETGRESTPEAIENLIDRVAEPLGLSDGSVVCDVGCGYGGTSRHLAQRGAQVTGLTISSAQHAYAVEKTGGASNPTYLLRNWEQNELDEGSFDGLVSIECCSHVVDKKRYFDEVFRVLRPGARAGITVWLTGENPSRRAERWLLEPICREGRLPSMWKPSETAKLAEESGLKVVEYQDWSRKVRRTWRICVWRVMKTLMFTRVGWKFLLSSKSSHAVYIFSVLRIMIAYYTGAMVYGYYVLEKPSDQS